MKKNLFLIVLFFFSITNYTSAQRLLEPGNNWNLIENFWLSFVTKNYSIGSDTLVNGITYQQILRDGALVDYQEPITPRFIRETNDGKVYVKNHIYFDTDEILIYDFGLGLMDTFTLAPSLNPNRENKFLVTAIDAIVLLNGDLRRQITLESVDVQSNNTLTWVEGIGDLDIGPFYYHSFHILEFGANLLCAYQEDNIHVYQNPAYDSCFFIPTAVEELDINSDIKIYPNPVDDLLTLDLSETNQSFTEINIFNALGELVYQNDKPITITEINIRELQTGIYFLLLKNKSGMSYSQRIIKR